MVKYYSVKRKTMNKLVVPVVLAAILLVAGIFVLMPVDKASTVHTAIAVQNVAFADDRATNVAANTILIADSNTIKTGTVCAQLTDAVGTNDAPTLVVERTTDDETVGVLTNAQLEAGECAPFTGFELRMSGVTSDAGDLLDFAVAWRET
jgi:hypothetical protein